VNQNPKSCGVSPACRMMERVVPMGSSFFGWGNDGDSSGGVLVFGVAALLGGEVEIVLLKHANDFRVFAGALPLS